MSDEVLSFWNEKTLPHFYKRSDVVYSRLPLKESLYRRGIYSSIITNLTKHLPAGAFIAGGFIASLVRGVKEQKPSDIDIFFNSGDTFLQTYKLFTNPPGDDGGVFHGYHTDIELDQLTRQNSRTTRLVKFTNEDPEKLPVQLIKMVWYDNAEAVIDSFDFTACQFAVDGDQFVFNPIAMVDLYRGRLVMHRYQYPAETLYRVIKYTKKGYSTSPLSLMEIAKGIRDCTEMDPPGIAKMY